MEHVDTNSKLIGSIVLSGFVLSLLIPIGAFFGIYTYLYDAVFFAHIFLHTVSLIFALKVLGDLFLRETNGRIWAIVCSLFLLLILLIGSMPPHYKDALIHHLAILKYWLGMGKIYEIFWHYWSYYPPLLQTAYAGFLKYFSEQCCSWYQMSHLILLAAVLATTPALEELHPRYRIFAATVCITLPLNVFLSSTAMVDISLALFLSCGISLLSRDSREVTVSQMLYAGTAFGLALCTKYNAIPATAIFLMFYFLIAMLQSQSIRRPLITAATVGIVCALVYAPTGIKNIIWNENPFFPLFISIFGGESFYSGMRTGVAGLSPIEKRIHLWGESPLVIAFTPLWMILFGKDGAPQFYDGVTSPILLFLFVPLIFLRRTSYLAMLFYLYMPTYMFIALNNSSARSRYMIPLALPVFVLTTHGVRHFVTFLEKYWKKAGIVVPTLLFLHVAFAANYAASLVKEKDVVPYLSGEVTRDEYLRARLSDYPTIEFLNANIPRGDKIYLLYTGIRFYYHEGNVRGGYFSAWQLLDWINRAESLEELIQSINRSKYRYLVANKRRTMEGFGSILKEDKKELWNSFGSRCLQEIYSDSVNIVWKICEH